MAVRLPWIDRKRAGDDSEEVAVRAQEIGAEVIRGPVCDPSESGDFAVGGVDIGEYLYELKGQEVMLVIAPIGPAEELPIICGLCGTPYRDDDCPTCRAEREDARRVIEERLRKDREETDGLIRDVEEWLGSHPEDSRDA
jgi:hypothetical protein